MSALSLNFNFSGMYSSPNYYDQYNSGSAQSRYPYYHYDYSNYGYYNGYYNNNSSNQYGSYYNPQNAASFYRSNRYSYSSDQLNKYDLYNNYYDNQKSAYANGYMYENKSTNLSKTKPLSTSCENLSYSSKYNSNTTSNGYNNSYYNNGYGSFDQLNNQSISNYSNHSHSYSNLSNNNNNYSSYNYNNYNNNISDNTKSYNNTTTNKNNAENKLHSNYETTLNDYYKNYSNSLNNNNDSASGSNLTKKGCPCSHHGSSVSLGSQTSNNYDKSGDNYYSSNNNSSSHNYLKNYNDNSLYQGSNSSNYYASTAQNITQSTSSTNLKSYDLVNQSNTCSSALQNNKCEDGYTCSDFVPLSQASVLDKMITSNSNNLSNQNSANLVKLDYEKNPEKIVTNITNDQTPALAPSTITVTIKEDSKMNNQLIDHSQKQKSKIDTKIKESSSKIKSDISKSRLSFKESAQIAQSPFKVISEKSTISSSDSIPSFTTLDPDESLRITENYSSLDQRDVTVGEFVPYKRSKKYTHSLLNDSQTNNDTKTEYLSTSFQSSINPIDKNNNINLINYKNEYKAKNHDLILDNMVDQLSNDFYSNFKANDYNRSLYSIQTQSTNNLNRLHLIPDENIQVKETKGKNNRLDLLLDQLVSKLTEKDKKISGKINDSLYESEYLSSTANSRTKTKENYSREFKIESNYDPELEKFYAQRGYSIYESISSKQSLDSNDRTHSNYLTNNNDQQFLRYSNKNKTNSNRSSIRQEWDSLGLLSTNGNKSSRSNYTNELFGSNSTPSGIPLRELIDSRSSNTNDEKINHLTKSKNDNYYGMSSQLNLSNNNYNLYNNGRTYRLSNSKDTLYDKQDKTIDLIAKYLKPK